MARFEVRRIGRHEFALVVVTIASPMFLPKRCSSSDFSQNGKFSDKNGPHNSNEVNNSNKYVELNFVRLSTIDQKMNTKKLFPTI